MTVSIRPGYYWEYFVRQEDPSKKSESYYTQAADHSEPPGVWYGRGAEMLGLVGEVDPLDMEALYGNFVDPRDSRFRVREAWAEAAKLGQPPRKYKSTQDLLEQKLAAEPYATPERIEELRAEAAADTRHANAFIDVTTSPVKSFTMAWTSFRAQENAARREGDEVMAGHWGRQAQLVEDALFAGHHAALEYLAKHAGFQRVGYHGKDTAGRWEDAHDWTVANFLQFTNRDNDPQLHIHGVVLNRTLGVDGKWRTLESRAIHKARAGAAATAEMVMEEQLIRTLGAEFRMRPDGVARELVGVSPEARALFSSRRHAVSGRVAELVEKWEAKYGSSPNALQLAALSVQATKETRTSKAYDGESLESLVDRAALKLRTNLDETMADIAEQVPGRVAEPVAEAFSVDAVIEAAVTNLQAKQSTWNQHHLRRAIRDQLPDCLGGLTARHVNELLDELVRNAITPSADRVGGPSEVVRVTAPDLVTARAPRLLRLDGLSVFEPTSPEFATRAALDAEQELIQSAQTVDEYLVADVAHVDRALAGTKLGADQLAAVRGVLTSGRCVETLIGPAGTGKSYTVGHLAALWEDPETWGPAGEDERSPRVFGLATAQAAADILAEEGLTRTANIRAWTGAQMALDLGSRSAADERFRLRSGDLIIVDEAGMSSLDQISAIEKYARDAGAKVLLTGDPAQLRSVGAGGTMRLIAQEGVSYELGEARRFTASWEAQASLRLRDGDPTVLPIYDRQGRIVQTTTPEQAEIIASEGYVADRIAGMRSLMIVPTNERAAAVSAQIRADLMRYGLVGEAAVELRTGPDQDMERTIAGVGDMVQARKNDWSYLREQGRAVVNRELYRVLSIDEHGGMSVQPLAVDGSDEGSPLLLRPDYVATNLTLGYAVTDYCAQGATVDTTWPVITDATSAASLYTGMTRGRLRNVAVVATVRDMDMAREEGEEQDQRSALEVMATILLADEPDLSATEYARESLAQAESLRTLGARYTDVAGMTYEDRYGPILDEIVTEGGMSPRHRETLVGSDGDVGQLWRLVRAAELAGHDPRQVLHRAVGQRELDTARSIPAVVHDRILDRLHGALEPQANSYAERTPEATDLMGEYLAETAEAMDSRRRELGEQVAEQVPTPPWVLRRFGHAPDDVVEREEWTQAISYAAAYREQAGIDDEQDAIGPAPAVGQPELRAAWHAAWRAFGAPEDERELAALTVPQLRTRVTAYEREAQWEPTWMGAELKATALAARRYRKEAVLNQAAANNPDTFAADRAELQQLADAYRDMANQLDQVEAQLQRAVDKAGEWYLQTADLRHDAAAAATELKLRGATAKAAPDTRVEDLIDLHATVEQAADDAVQEAELSAAQSGAREVLIPEQRAEAESVLADEAPADRQLAASASVEADSAASTEAQTVTSETEAAHEAESAREAVAEQDEQVTVAEAPEREVAEEQTVEQEVDAGVDNAHQVDTETASRQEEQAEQQRVTVAWPENVPTKDQADDALSRAEAAVEKAAALVAALQEQIEEDEHEHVMRDLEQRQRAFDREILERQGLSRGHNTQ